MVGSMYQQGHPKQYEANGTIGYSLFNIGNDWSNLGSLTLSYKPIGVQILGGAIYYSNPEEIYATSKFPVYLIADPLYWNKAIGWRNPKSGLVTFQPYLFAGGSFWGHKDVIEQKENEPGEIEYVSVLEGGVGFRFDPLAWVGGRNKLFSVADKYSKSKDGEGVACILGCLGAGGLPIDFRIGYRKAGWLEKPEYYTQIRIGYGSNWAFGLVDRSLTLKIEGIKGKSGIITIPYTTKANKSDKLVTIDHQYSIDDGKTWLNIDKVSIGNNESKPPGSSYITWDTEHGENNLADSLHQGVSLRMKIKVELDPYRESKSATSPLFIVDNHITAAITFPTRNSHLRHTVSILGTTSVKEAQLQSWILDFAKGGNPKGGYIPIQFSQRPVNNSQLAMWDTTKQPDGIYTLRLRVTDATVKSRMDTVVVTVDNTPPNSPIVEIKPLPLIPDLSQRERAGVRGDYAQSGGKLAVSGMTEAEIKSARLLDQNNRPLSDVTSHIKISEAGAITGNIPIGKLSNNVSGLKLQLVIADQAGNEAQAESNIVPVDNVTPEIKLTSPVDGAYFNAPPIVISGTASDEQTGIEKVEVNTGTEWAPVDTIAGKWSYTYTPPIVDVLLNFQARAYDRAGNQRETPKITVNYLSAMPTANISAPADGDEVGGAFNVIGSVDDIDTDYSDFSWTLEYAQGSDARSGFQVIREGKSPVQNSILTDASLPKGACTLRLTVKNSIGSVEIRRRNITVMEGAVALKQPDSRVTTPAQTIQRTFPVLKIENVRLDEPSGNQALDADETGKITFQISNSGKGTATKVQVKLTTEQEINGLLYKQSQTIPNIAPNSSQTVEIPISTTEAVASAQFKLKVEVLEGGVGADAEPIILAFETRELKPPQLKIASSAIDDDEQGESQGNANGKIEPGEQIEVDVVIQNAGVGDAENVLAQVSVPQDIVYASQSPRFDLGRIEAGKWKKLHFSIWINKRYADEEIPLGIYIKEKRERFSLSKTLSLPLNKKIELPEIFAIAPQEETGVTIETAPSLQVDVDVNIPQTSVSNPDAIAVVIGNRDYVYPNVPKVLYAVRDATVMRDYLIKTFGFKEGNILFYENATQAQFNSLFGTEKDYKGRLFDLVKPEKSDVFIYYSGHGASDPEPHPRPLSEDGEERQGYFVPVDCDPRRVKLNGYSLNLFYQNVSKIPANSFTIVIDACFSGISHGGSLLGNISPIFTTIENPMMLLPNATVMTAARGDEVSGWYPEKRHGLFTYFFLKGISGDADKDGNGELTAIELKNFLTDETEGVPYWARRLHSKEQHPDVFSSPLGRGRGWVGGEGKVLVKY
jgi:hypothetical protein